jgi:MFS family permease
MVAFILGHLLVEFTDLSWQLILGSSTLIAVVLFIARLGLPESPHWLWLQGRKDEAYKIAGRYMESSADMSAVRHEGTKAPKGSFGMLFSRQYWRATLFTSGFWFCAVTPYFAIATFADSVLQQYGISGGLVGGGGLSVLALLAVVITVLLIDKAGTPRAYHPAAVVVHRVARGHWAVGGRASAGRPDPVPHLLLLQRDVHHTDWHLPDRSLPNRDPRARNGIRGGSEPYWGGSQHVSAAMVHV